MNHFLVNYKYVTKTGAVRNASLVVQAIDNKGAEAKALEKIPEAHQWPQVSKISTYLPTPAPEQLTLPTGKK